ncbi:TIGR04141 family sporadically distributed protein [uncultured Roseibium sp.]|uniref:TIGR04141 family sporadically distributed protein n=1 Tax=uncultured Roseibium sp. TaxID=1936171 RepID=UPI00263368C4|nr:TIGR04141 family sporadically distributed protein [uncultured Roseibium sp.]
MFAAFKPEPESRQSFETQRINKMGGEQPFAADARKRFLVQLADHRRDISLPLFFHCGKSDTELTHVVELAKINSKLFLSIQPMSKTKSYSLYLVKPDIEDFEDVFTEPAKEKIQAGDAVLRESDDLGDKAIVYIFPGPPKPPSWLADINTVFDGAPALTNRSSCAIVVFKHVDRVFVTAFAHGWQYLDDTKIESDFGLKVAINSLNDSKVKRIDSSHLGEAIKGVSQSAFQRDLQAFGVDEALDLVRRISGRVEDDDFANSISGATGLKITREMEFVDLPETAEEALTRSQSQDYQNTGFYIIDKVRPILDKLVLATLDQKAVDLIKAGADNFELSMPGWSEDDVVYYGLYGPGLKGRFPDLLMSNYRDALDDKLGELDIEAIRKHGVVAEFNNDAGVKKRWSIKKALVGSVVEAGGLYAISEGEWYRLDQQFKSDIDAAFVALKEDWPDPPLIIIKKVSEDGKKSGFESELSYNERCAGEYGQVLLDQKILTVPATPYGKFEACDLLDIESKRLIHVKKSSRQSSVLSHFFKQGSNSARILKTIPEARVALVEMVRDLTDDPTANALEAAMGDAMIGWKVEFHIVDAPRNDGTFMIPFFSRITLRDESRTLKGMAYDVSLRFVPTSPA